MSRLIRLYPRAWRDRYEDEFVALVEAHRPGVRDRVDIVRSAVDARIHPQVQARPEPRGEGELHMSTRVGAAIAAVAGGAVIAGAGLGMNATSVTPSLGYKESGWAFLAAATAFMLLALAAFLSSQRLPAEARYWRAVPAAMFVAALLVMLPWPVSFVGFFATIAAATVFGLVMYGAQGRPTGILIAVTSVMLFGFNTETGAALLTVPFGVAWVAFGLDVLIRRARNTLAEEAQAPG